MFHVIFLVVASILSAQNALIDFSVDMQLAQPPTREEIKLRIQVKNLSARTIKIPTHRRQDFRREKIKSIGNYVIEIEKYDNNRYSPFSPSADIDPNFENQEYISLKEGGSITDSIYINGYDFSKSAELKRGFPAGGYRLRISFNSSMWSDSRESNSHWLEFKIE